MNTVMANANRSTMTDDAGSYFVYDTKIAAQADAATFNCTVEHFHATVGLADDEAGSGYIVNVWYGRSGAAHACTFGPNWKQDLKM